MSIKTFPNIRLDFKNWAKPSRGFSLLPGQDGEEQRGGHEEGEGAPGHAGGQVSQKNSF